MCIGVYRIHMKRIISSEEEQGIMRLYRSGIGCPTIANRVGWCPNTIRLILLRNHEPMRSQRESVSKLTDKQRRYIVKRYQAGATIEQLRKELGISQSPIDDSLRKFGI